MVILDSIHEDVLQMLQDGYDGNEKLYTKFEVKNLPENIRSDYSKVFKELKISCFLASYALYGQGGHVYFSKEGLKYFSDKEKYLEKREMIENTKSNNIDRQNISIRDINAFGSIITLGDIMKSEITIDNSLKQIEKMIDEKGGEDKEVLLELLKECKEIVDEIKNNDKIPKHKGFFKKVNEHLEKHGWFYGAILQMFGQVVITSVG